MKKNPYVRQAGEMYGKLYATVNENLRGCIAAVKFEDNGNREHYLLHYNGEEHDEGWPAKMFANTALKSKNGTRRAVEASTPCCTNSS
jgi:hypothetical protein